MLLLTILQQNIPNIFKKGHLKASTVMLCYNANALTTQWVIRFIMYLTFKEKSFVKSLIIDIYTIVIMCGFESFHFFKFELKGISLNYNDAENNIIKYTKILHYF